MANPSDRVTVRVGEQDFVTSRTTLMGSGLFTTLLSSSPPDQDEYFVDADAALFAHVLRYLRTKTFPLFYDNRGGHDICLYLALLQQAKFYQVEPLESWIMANKYLDAVKTKSRVVAKTLYGDQQIEAWQDLVAKRGEITSVLSVDMNRQRGVWYCPAQNWRHHGSKADCHAGGCEVRRELFTEMSVMKVIAVMSSVVISMDVCLPSGPEGADPPPYYPETAS